ncbi:DUF6216 family protein [Polaromonas sp. UC242_47]|uniref:DUF6216 family protein n=1 Tax=Polaromonas sp. UC242_47 TaxID=3374626 RepID=UPI0037B9A98C
MDSATLSIISSAFGVLAPALFVLLFIWVWWRTESRHVLFYRLWQLVHGSKEISDPEVKAFIDEQTSLMSFRFVTGVRVKSLKDAQALIQWTRRNDIDMGAISLCGEYFDPDQRQVLVKKLPSKPMQGAKLLLAGSAVVAAYMSMLGIYNDYAVLKFKDSGRSFLASTEQARALSFGVVAIQKSSCSNDKQAIPPKTEFSEQETQVICKFLNEEASQIFIKKTVSEQRQSFGLLLIAMAWVAWSSLRAWLSGKLALRLARRKFDPDPSDRQLNLDLSAR